MNNIKPNTQAQGMKTESVGMGSEMRCQLGGTEFVGLGLFCRLVLSALGVH